LDKLPAEPKRSQLSILVSNDDGIFAPGLTALAGAMLEFGKVTVIAPEDNQSANGHRKTLTKPLRANPVHIIEGVTAYSTDGAPADCIALALLGLIRDPVDLVVSGINRGPNLGQDLTYSGTVAAAFEGTIHHKPSIAFSLDNRAYDADYSAAAEVAKRVVRLVSETNLPAMTLLNVNIPGTPLRDIKGFQVTQQGTSIYRDKLVERFDPEGRPYYWIGGEAPTGDTSIEMTDIWAVHHGYVSITPVRLDLTAYAMLDTLKTWQF
jgi:5'-nucleotidase